MQLLRLNSRSMRLSSFSLLIFAFSVHYLAAQPQLSPKLQALKSESRNSFRRFTLQVKDTRLFEDQYPAVQIISRYDRTGAIVIEAAPVVLESIMNDDNVLFIDIPGIPRDEAVLERSNFNYNRIRKAQVNAPDIRGDNLTISQKEQSFNDTDIDLLGRTFKTAITSSTSSQHATQMATIIGGAGNFLEAYTGVVPGVTLTSSDYANLLPDDPAYLTGLGISIQNHSYGVSVENYYGAEAVAYDDATFNEPQMLHVFSSGNFGSVIPDTGPYAGLRYANLSGTFKQAKNVLLVNAVDTSHAVNIRNSIGPAFDGRIKPEITAFGAGGTSEAAALVTGSAGFLSQLYQNKNGGNVPSSAVLKSILIAGSDDIGATGPDFKTGYGSLNLNSSRKIIENEQFREMQLGSSETKALQIDVPAGMKELKIAVCWTDPPAAVNSTKTLVHDLSAVLKFGGQTYLPWVLSSYPSIDSLEALAVRKEDHLNNVEFITVDVPASGTYVLEVSAPVLATLSQHVAVAWSMRPLNSFSWDYPYDSAKLIAGEKIDLFWETTYTDLAQLELKIGDGNWAVIASDIALAKRFSWTPPVANAPCQLRMKIGTENYESGPFLVSRKMTPDFSFVCDELVGLIWEGLPEATGYRVYQMGEQLMTQLLHTDTDTSYVGLKTGSPYYAVAPVIAGWTGPRSLARDYTFSGTFCFIDFFQASKTGHAEVLIQLQLSTLDHLTRVSITREHGGVTELVSTFTPDNTQFNMIDRGARPGRNQYWATLEFDSEQLLSGVLVSDTSELYLENPGKLILFPNPSNEEKLNILSDGTGQLMRIYDQNGKFLFQKELYDSYDEITIFDLRPGSYFYRLFDSGKVIDRGRFVKY